jgi:hypothetical protein
MVQLFAIISTTIGIVYVFTWIGNGPVYGTIYGRTYTNHQNVRGSQIAKLSTRN